METVVGNHHPQEDVTLRENPDREHTMNPPQVGHISPWGQIDGIEELADGIVQVFTPGHGGIWLSPERLAAMPAEQRSTDGWYEEDCEAVFPLARFLDECKPASSQHRERWEAAVLGAVARYDNDFSEISMDRAPSPLDAARVQAAEALAAEERATDTPSP